jgi:hypothetical protein
LSKKLTGVNEFVIRSNDLFEVIMYHSALHFSKGDIACLLQDDDIPPDGESWLVDALSLFNKYPQLQILGGKKGLDVLPREITSVEKSSEYTSCVRIVKHAGVNHYHLYNKPIFRQPDIGVPFMFTMAVNRVPMFIRREAFLSTGGISQNSGRFSVTTLMPVCLPGAKGCRSDYILCTFQS